ncbi:hypothetical protein BGX38DRAFT_1259702 [Terfezia claveryi]|nr:hypothetical protein BGX38DRAFT_1259702 [Terfezia claveryi]
MAAALRTTTMRSSIRGAIRPSISIAQLQIWMPQALRAFSLSSPTLKNSPPAPSLRPKQNQKTTPLTTSTLPARPLPTINPTSSKDLDSLLAHFRKELFTEPHLLERQRLIEEDSPKLIPRNCSRKMFTKAVQMMNVPSDFDAIPELVLGYTQGGLKLLDKHISLAVRRAGLTGRADVLMSILEQAGHNKIHIPMSIAREGFRGFIVMAKLPSKHAVIEAVVGARHLRNLLQEQDTLLLDQYQSVASRQSEAGKTQSGIEASLGPEPVKIAKDPVGLGTLVGSTSEASKRFNGGLDHKGYTAWYVKKMFLPESWDSVKDELGKQWESVRTPDSKYEETREAFHNRKATIKDLGVFIDSIKSAEEVLSKTANYILSTPVSEIDTSLFNPKHGVTEKNIKDHGVEAGELAKSLRREIPIIEQGLDKWVEVMVEDGAKVMRWSEAETRTRMEGTKTTYEWAARELVNKGVGLTKAKSGKVEGEME